MLLARLRAGDELAFRALVDRHRPWLVRLCTRLLGHDAHAAEDAAQESLLKLHTAARRGQPLRVRPWLTVVARNTCVDEQRRRRPDLPGELPERAVAGHDPFDLDAALSDAWSRLAGRHREVLYLREVLGFSYKEIGAVMGLSMAATETLVFRARAALRREYERSGGTSFGSALLGLQLARLGLDRRRDAAVHERRGQRGGDRPGHQHADVTVGALPVHLAAGLRRTGRRQGPGGGGRRRRGCGSGPPGDQPVRRCAAGGRRSGTGASGVGADSTSAEPVARWVRGVERSPEPENVAGQRGSDRLGAAAIPHRGEPAPPAAQPATGSDTPAPSDAAAGCRDRRPLGGPSEPAGGRLGTRSAAVDPAGRPRPGGAPRSAASAAFAAGRADAVADRPAARSARTCRSMSEPSSQPDGPRRPTRRRSNPTRRRLPARVGRPALRGRRRRTQ